MTLYSQKWHCNSNKVRWYSILYLRAWPQKTFIKRVRASLFCGNLPAQNTHTHTLRWTVVYLVISQTVHINANTHPLCVPLLSNLSKIHFSHAVMFLRSLKIQAYARNACPTSDTLASPVSSTCDQAKNIPSWSANPDLKTKLIRVENMCPSGAPASVALSQCQVNNRWRWGRIVGVVLLFDDSSQGGIIESIDQSAQTYNTKIDLCALFRFVWTISVCGKDWAWFTQGLIVCTCISLPTVLRSWTLNWTNNLARSRKIPVITFFLDNRARFHQTWLTRECDHARIRVGVSEPLQRQSVEIHNIVDSAFVL